MGEMASSPNASGSVGILATSMVDVVMGPSGKASVEDSVLRDK
jgi:hypothetical protein